MRKSIFCLVILLLTELSARSQNRDNFPSHQIMTFNHAVFNAEAIKALNIDLTKYFPVAFIEVASVESHCMCTPLTEEFLNQQNTATRRYLTTLHILLEMVKIQEMLNKRSSEMSLPDIEASRNKIEELRSRLIN